MRMRQHSRKEVCSVYIEGAPEGVNLLLEGKKSEAINRALQGTELADLAQVEAKKTAVLTTTTLRPTVRLYTCTTACTERS